MSRCIQKLALVLFLCLAASAQARWTVNNLNGGGAFQSGVAGSEVVTGTWSGGAASGRTCGAAGPYYCGTSFAATVTGTVRRIKMNVTVKTVNDTWHAELWSDSSGSPGSQIGVDSDSESITGTGDVTFTFSTEPSITNSTTYWIVIIYENSGRLDFDTVTGDAGYESSRNATITPMTANLPSGEEWKMEITQFGS